MIFLPFIAGLTITIGEAIGIGASVVGIGAAIKGAADYHEAKSIQESSCANYQNALNQINRKSKEVLEKFESFGLLKLKTYTGVIREAVELLSNHIKVDLSSFNDIQIEQINIFSNELIGLKESVIKASDVLSCLSVGVNTAVNDRFQYKDTPPIFQTIGAFGIKKFPHSTLPNIPYAAITMAGITWGLSGSNARLQAETNAIYASNEIEKMKLVESGFEALVSRINEGEKLINILTEKLLNALTVISTLPEKDETMNQIENVLALTRALKQVIEVDICCGNGLLTPESGVMFHAVRKEYVYG